MHIAILIGRFPPGVVGGAELQAQTWARRLAGRHRITVVTRLERRGQPQREERDGFTVLRLPPAPLPIWRAFADMAGIERTLAEMSPRPDVLLCFMTFLSGLAGTRAGARLGIPAVVWVRGEAEYRLSPPRLERWISPGVWRDARGVLVQSEWNRVELLRELEAVSLEQATRLRPRLEVVPNGLQLPEGPFVPGGRVLTVCRLIADKGVDDLITACAEAHLPLTVAGDGPQRPALEQLARGLGADVRFEGFVDRGGLDRLYREASAFVLASQRGEGLPNAVLEAMSYARPVVVTTSGATRDLVRSGYNGQLVGAGDRPALVAALRGLHADPSFAAAMGARARTTTERFAWDMVQARLEDVLERWALPPRGRVCFYMPHLYPVVGGGRMHGAGGAEVQVTLVAKGLVRRGFDVDIVTGDYGQRAVEVAGGVRLLRAWRPEAGWPVLRFFHPRLTTTLARLLASRADVYMVKGSGFNAGLVCDLAHRLGKKFVLITSQDLDVTAGLPRVRGWRDRRWALRGLLGADAVVVQTERQRELFRAGYGLDSTLITNVGLLPAASADAGGNDTVLWVGSYAAGKRPDWFVRFAERNPDVRCAMAGVVPPDSPAEREFRRALDAAARLPNLEVQGPIDYDKVGTFYARGALLAHSSPEEGFPNTLLEAWSLGLPTVTTFDPDGMIVQGGLGECHGSFDDWEDAIQRWMRDPERRRAAGVRARTHVAQTHALYRVAERYGAVLDEVLERRTARPAWADVPEIATGPEDRAPVEPRAPAPPPRPVRRGRRAVRVAFLQATLGIGGAERLVQSLIRRMRPGLVTPVAVTLYEPGPVGEELIADDRTVISRLAGSRYDSQVGRRLREVFDANGIDVVYVIDSPLPKFWMGVLRRSSTRPRVVLGFHSTGTQGHAVQHFVSSVAMSPVVDRQVALSETHRQFLARTTKQDPSAFEVIANGVNLERFTDTLPREAARASAGLPPGVPLAGLVAALRPEKNHALFLRAARAVAERLPEARFFLAGDGPERGTIERLVRELGLEGRVLLLGARRDVADLFRAADVAVLSSHALVETLPISLLEAAACGTPIVSTDVGSVRDIVTDGLNGFLVPAGDEAAFAARLGKLLTDAPQRERMGVSAREVVRARFDEREMLQRYERLFRDVAGEDL